MASKETAIEVDDSTNSLQVSEDPHDEKSSTEKSVIVIDEKDEGDENDNTQPAIDNVTTPIKEPRKSMPRSVKRKKSEMHIYKEDAIPIEKDDSGSTPSQPAKRQRLSSEAASAKKAMIKAEQAQKRAQRERERIMKLQQKEEETKQKQIEKEKLQQERQKQKEQEEREKEEKRKEREEMKKQKEKEKEEEKRQMEEKRKLKEEEKRKKEEERLQKEIEKKKEEEAQQKKLQRQSQFFSSFFKKNENSSKREATTTNQQLPQQESALDISTNVTKDTSIVIDDDVDEVPNVQSTSICVNNNDVDEFKMNSQMPQAQYHMFKAFQIKMDTKLAPKHRYVPIEASVDEVEKKLLENTEKIDEVLLNRRVDLDLKTVIKSLNESKPYPETSPLEPPEIFCYDESKQLEFPQWMRVKLLQFIENYRPPYYGTYRRLLNRHGNRIATNINARRPFAKDYNFFDYAYDSDDEWENEEEPGEDIEKSDDGNNNEADEDKLLDEEGEAEGDGFVVPHGYLSDDEGLNESSEEDVQGEGGREAQEDSGCQMRRIRQQLALKEYEANQAKKLQPLKMDVWGVNFINMGNQNFDNVEKEEDALCDMLKCSRIRAEMLASSKAIIWPGIQTPVSCSLGFLEQEATKTNSNKKVFPEEAIPHLIRLLHGNKLSRKKISYEFRMFWELQKTNRLPQVTFEEDCRGIDWGNFSLSRRQMDKQINEIAKYKDGAYWVSQDILTKYKLQDLQPNQWNYVSKINEKIASAKKVNVEAPPQSHVSPTKLLPETSVQQTLTPASTQATTATVDPKLQPITKFFA